MYDGLLDSLIEAALKDGVLTEKERRILFKRAKSMGVDEDELDMVLEARLQEIEQRKRQNAFTSATQTNKLGDVRKCPQCGAAIGTFHMTCPECGFEFNNVGVNRFVEKFSRKLKDELADVVENQVNSILDIVDITGAYSDRRKKRMREDREAQFVKNYPLPMAKEDCLEMLNFIVPKLSVATCNSATFAWKKLYGAILQKVECEAKSDPQLLETVDTYKAQGHMNALFSLIVWFRSLSEQTKTGIFVVFLFIVIYGAGLPVLTHFLNREEEMQEVKEEQVSQYISNGDLAGAVELVRKGCDATPLYNYYMDKGMYDEAEDYIPHEHGKVMPEEYFNYCKKAVMDMCKAGQQEEATRFIKRKMVLFDDTNPVWNTEKIEEKLNTIVDNYLE